MHKLSAISFNRMRSILATVIDNPKAIVLYADDLLAFVDDAEANVAELRQKCETVRGSFDNNRYASLRSAQIMHKQYVWRDRPHICEHCGDNLIWDIYKLHHVKAVKDGGTFDDDNLLMLCANCHAVIH